MLCGNSDENGNAIRDYDTAKRIRRRVTLQQKQFKKQKAGDDKIWCVLEFITNHTISESNWLMRKMGIPQFFLFHKKV